MVRSGSELERVSPSTSVAPLSFARSTNSCASKVWPPPQPDANAAAAASEIRVVRSVLPLERIAAGWHTRKMDVLAHAGHWLVNILYALPVLVVAGSIIVSVIRQRREARDTEADPPVSAP